MSVFIIKLIAIITMLIDHLGFTLSATGNTFIIPSTMMRTIGRIAFPLFAFLLINGWKYTSNKRKYLKNMMIFAVISHIPFTLAIGNYTQARHLIESKMVFNKFDFNFNFSNYDSLGFIVIMIAAYIYFIWKDDRDWTIVPAVIFAVLPFFTLYGDKGVFISLPKMNIFYTFVVGMMIIASIEKIFDLFRMKTEREQANLYSELSSDEVIATDNCIHNSEDYDQMIGEYCEDNTNIKDNDVKEDVKNNYRKFGVAETLLLAMVTIFAIYILNENIDYGKYGLLLITGLYIVRRDKKSQMFFILLWTVIYYSFEGQNLTYVASASLSILPVLLYNEKKGPGLKYMFYAFYPVHLLILGLYSCYTVFIAR